MNAARIPKITASAVKAVRRVPIEYRPSTVTRAKHVMSVANAAKSNVTMIIPSIC
jgi:hypothetical protein